MTAEQGSVRLRRTIFAPPALVYRAWLDPGQLSRWLPPAGLTVVRADVDERAGGRYAVWYLGPNGAVGGIDCELLELVPDRRIVLDWHFIGRHPALDSRLTVSFHRASGEATKLTLVHELPGVARPRDPSPVLAEATHVPREELAEIWRQYKASGDRLSRDRLILTYAPLVKYVAGKLGSWLPPHVEEGDLIAYGLLGLIGAIERFEPDREIKFETYAISRIRAAMIDELHSLDRVPPAADPSRGLVPGELRQALAQAITRLPDRERLVVTLSYYEGLTLREIGEVLSLTESHVSQLHSKANLRLRAWLRIPLAGPPLLARAAVAPGTSGSSDSGWRELLDRLAAALAEAE